MEDKKKIIILTAAIVGIFLLIILIGFVILPAISNMAAKKNVPENNGGDTSISDDGSLSLEEQAKQIFNDFYTSYETKDDETLPAASIAMLFTTLANQNDENDRKVDANGVIVTKNNLELQKEILSDEMRYKVKCIYDDEGYVKTVEIRYTPSSNEGTQSRDSSQGDESGNNGNQGNGNQDNGGQAQEGQQ